jgi:transcription initiation factor IIE alpha subunit
MPLAKFCHVKLTVSQALAIRNTDDSVIKDYRMRFKCVECGQAVRPYESTKNAKAYFAHLKRNKDCSLSDQLDKKAKS